MTAQVFSDVDCTQKAYDLDYYPLDFNDAPVHGMLCLVEANSRSAVHNHFEVEFFYFLSGEGFVFLDNESIPVKAGQGIRIPAFVNHYVENKNRTEPLRFISFYWEKPSNEAEDLKISTANTHLIFSTPPTPNGDLHLGHLSGPYLAADIYRRYIQACGNKAMHVTGRDDHQSYVASKAFAIKKEPLQVANHYADLIQKTLHNFGIDLNYFITPNKEGEYAHFVRTLFSKLYETGFIIEKTEEAPFSSLNQHYLHEAFIRGVCPYCQRESDGNACEECGRPNQCVDLQNPVARVVNQTVFTAPCKRLYFKMSLLKTALDEYIKSTPMSPHALTLSQGMIIDGLPDICVSHVSNWGIPVPVPGFESQTIYVWFEMAFGYLWAALQLAPEHITGTMEKIQWYYQQNQNKIVHFYGFDNTYYHTLLFPAVYFALGGLNPPTAHVVNELLDLEGSKFSTSRGHLIWGNDLLKTAPVDYIRWFLCEVRPENLRSNFKLAAFSHSVNTLFNQQLQQWIRQVFQVTENDFDRRVPEAGAWTPLQRQFYNTLFLLRHRILAAYSAEHYSLRTVTVALREMVKTAVEFQAAEFLYLKKEYVSNQLRTSIALSLFALKMFTLLSKPIVPTISEQLSRFLSLPDEMLLTDTHFISPTTILEKLALPEFPELNEAEILSVLNSNKESNKIECV